ncbi:MAG TPA: cyclase family protein [Conexibacter sp.]|jgi:kynurenine formamidase
MNATASPQTALSSATVDPVSGLHLIELSHPWGHGAPAAPGFAEPQIQRSVNHAQHGVLSQRIRTVMHTGTHVNAPRHLVQGGDGVGSLALERLFAVGVVVSVPKQQWETISADDLERSDVRRGDAVVLVTGWHRSYGDSQRYYAHAPGLSREAAQWLVEREPAFVAIDTPHVDHPLATSLGAHRGGPTARYLPARYERETGRSAADDFPDWNPAHRALLAAGIPTLENVGGDVDELLGRRAVFHAVPWRWPDGDACPVRFVALLDPSGELRIESGAHDERA